MSAGHNWANVLPDFAATSGILAGFSVTFIALILGGHIADVEICTSGVTFGQISMFLFGSSSMLFIFASQRFLQANEFNVWELPAEYIRLSLRHMKTKNPEEWDKFLLESDASCRKYEREGGHSYDIAVFLLIGGLFFMIAPYSLVIAIMVAALGIVLEAIQYFI